MRYTFDTADLAEEFRKLRHTILWEGDFLSTNQLCYKYGVDPELVRSVDSDLVSPEEEDFTKVAEMIFAECSELGIPISENFDAYLKWQDTDGR